MLSSQVGAARFELATFPILIGTLQPGTKKTAPLLMRSNYFQSGRLDTYRTF